MSAIPRTLSTGIAALAMLAGLALPALADRALVIGIDAYTLEKLALGGKSSAHDAVAITRLLTENLGFAAADIKVLTDGEAS